MWGQVLCLLSLNYELAQNIVDWECLVLELGNTSTPYLLLFNYYDGYSTYSLSTTGAHDVSVT